MNTRQSGGFTIVEVLVAMVILAIGVLGLGVMQLTSLQNTQSGQMKSQASILAYDIIDAMRTNSVFIAAGDINLGLDSDLPDPTNCYGADADCTSPQMALADLTQWRTALDSSLPSGRGGFTAIDLGTSTQMTVTISWVDPYTAADGDEQLVLTAELAR